MRIVWSEAAQRDLARVRAFLSSRSEAFALRVESRLFDRAAGLVTAPLQGRPVAGSGVRAISLTDIQYVLSYRPLPDLVVIVGVRHTREIRDDDDLTRGEAP